MRINEPRALRAGVTNEDVAVSLQTVLSGIETTQFREADEVIPVTLRSVAADRQDIGKLETLNVYSQATGRSVPLKQVADVEVEWEPSRIFRRDRLRHGDGGVRRADRNHRRRGDRPARPLARGGESRLAPRLPVGAGGGERDLDEGQSSRSWSTFRWWA